MNTSFILKSNTQEDWFMDGSVELVEVTMIYENNFFSFIIRYC